MLQLIGILLILNTLVSGVWWTAQNRAWSAGLAAFAGLGLIAGLTLAFHQRLLEIVRADVGDISAAARKAQDEAKAVTELREKMEIEIGELKRLAGKSAPTPPVEKTAPAVVEDVAPELTDLREKLAANATEIERLGKQLDEARQRAAEMGAAAAAPSAAAAPEATVPGEKPASPAPPAAPSATTVELPRGLPKSREILPPSDTKSRDRDHAALQKGRLKQRFEEAIEFHKKEQDGLAYVAAKACVELYESSKDAGKKDGPDLGGVTADGAAAIYSVAAEICQRVDQHERAVEWAQRAVALHPSPERKALLATTYLNFKMRDEADKIIEEANSGYDAASLELRKLLIDFGVIKAAQQ